MLSPQKSALLQSFLGGLPPVAAARLAKAVEIDRVAGGRVLPHELILTALRPMLGHMARTPTPLRLFCRPFEDLISAHALKEKQKGRIARASIIAVWNWVTRTLSPEESARYAADVKALVLAGRFDDALMRAQPFWTLASQAMSAAIGKDRKSVRTVLLNDTTVADAEEMALLLSVGTEIGAIQNLLPKPMPQLGEDLLWQLREIHDRLAAAAPDAAPYVAVVTMNRLAHPWEALKLPQLITHQSQDTLISSTDMGLVGDLLFADIEFHGSSVRNARHPMFDVDALINHLARFTEISSSIVKEIDIRRDGKWGKRLLKDRAAIAETMEGFMERAPKEVLAMLPVQKTGTFGGGPKAADFSKAVDDEKAERGLRYARLMVGSAPYAAAASFAAAQKEALDEASQHLRGYNEDLIREMRGTEDQRRVVLERQFELAAEATALFFSAEEADFLRRRARAALAAAA
jgi:hypothetical protein